MKNYTKRQKCGGHLYDRVFHNLKGGLKILYEKQCANKKKKTESLASNQKTLRTIQ